jgi:hypothetical protein
VFGILKLGYFWLFIVTFILGLDGGLGLVPVPFLIAG